MPIEYEIRDGVAWVRATGVLDDAGLLQTLRQLLADPAYASVSSDLFDAFDVSAFDLTGQGVRDVAEILRTTRSATRVAIVVSTLEAFGLGRMYELLRDDIDVTVFRERAEAIAWLTKAGGSAVG